ncbi:MAG: leucyl aminopeptidase family protein [Alphaproteobacteria bacterium]|nr:leucyl aminopeptidase family protein [Alphaproteobacteria bacterium]
MLDKIFRPVQGFTARKRKHTVTIIPIKSKDYKGWLDKQNAAVQKQIATSIFTGKPGQTRIIFQNGEPESFLIGVNETLGHYDLSPAISMLQKILNAETLKDTAFELDTSKLKTAEINNAHIGWGLACYSFDTLKSKTDALPALLWSKKADKKAVLSMLESINLLRDLVNLPANLLGPEEIEKTVKKLSHEHEASVKIIKDQDLLKQNFPLIYTVGQASPRRPRLIEMKWGKARDPKLTLVGKGVVFDTGGLDIKPSQYMRLMKKDMGGAAHVIALAKLIMEAKLPVRLRLLIPAVENAVGGAAFRPGDIIQSRKGLFVENTNTDAEGRLILADALTYACEDNPDLVIDYATLTGSARAGLGPDIPPVFCSNDKHHEPLRKTAAKAEDPIWPMPLWQPYRKHIESPDADLINSTGIPGDGIYSALFLQSFVEDKTDWMHLDVFSWEQTGRPGRPKGAADTGLRTMFVYLKERYA